MSNLQIPIGQQLIEGRQNIGLSREDIISILRIREQILDTIENDLYLEQTIDVFLKGHIVAYCKLVKITPQTILNQLESKGYDFPKPLAPQLEIAEKKKHPWLLSSILISLIFIFILFSSFEPTEQKRVITQPYHGYQSELQELS